MIRKDLRDKRAALLTQNRGLLDLARNENRELIVEELSELEKRNAEVDKLYRQIEAEERQAEAEAKREHEERRTGPNGGDGEDVNLGHYIFKVRFMPNEILARTTMTTDTGAFAIPAQFATGLREIMGEPSIVRPRAVVMPAGDPPDAAITMPAVDGINGGLTFTWIAEGSDKPETQVGFTEFTLTPHEVAATMTVTDKLLRNWPAFDALIKRMLRTGMAREEDKQFLVGTGGAKPRGVLNSPAKLNQIRTTAATVKFADLAAMLVKLLPESVGSSVWVANQTLLDDLVMMSSDTAAVSTIFIRGDVTKAIPSTLFGMPIYFTGKTPTAGTEGDLILADFSYYIIKDGSGPFVAASEHLLFRSNKTVIKAFWNVDGDSWMRAPITLDDGVTQVSPFVILK